MTNNDQFKQAIELELKQFEKYYHWLVENMPSIFFKELNPDWILVIVHALMGFETQEYFAEIHLKNLAITLCLDTDSSDLTVLERFSKYGIKNYTTYLSRAPFGSTQKNLKIAITYFTYGFEKPEEGFLNEECAAFLKTKYSLDESSIENLFQKMDYRFLRKMHPQMQATALYMLSRAEKRDHCQYEVIYNEDWKEKEGPSATVVLAWKNVPKHNFLYRLARVVHNHGLVMQRVDASYIDPYSAKSIFMLSFGLHGADGKAAWEATDLADFFQEMTSLKYFGSLDLIDKTFVSSKMVRGNLGNLLRAAMNFIHQVLVNKDPNLYTLENIEEGLCRHPQLTVKLLNAFELRFHPHKNDPKKFEEEKKEFLNLVYQIDTGSESLDLRRKNILVQGMNFVTHTLKTNFYRQNKTSFVFRLDPAYLDHAPFERSELFPELPYGIFFFKGMHYIGFHIRFRDLSRGGLRTVFPDRKERVLIERNQVFSECYNLAYTQHKKNKDIPEGGAKGVILLKPDERLENEMAILSKELEESGLTAEEVTNILERFKKEQKLEYLYQTQRSYIKCFLSLINCDPDGRLRLNNIVDYWKKPEYIYLGPDENMHDVMIEWIAAQSIKDRYKPGGSFISGKPVVGINHKKYGVTSLGVNVYMQQLLKYMGIDPDKNSFTLKMTGGPDGDVAGNQIYNLFRYYPQTAKLIALTDVSGTIFDPNGLDLKTLTDLFFAEKSIRHYPAEKLSKGGFLLDKETKRETAPYVFQTQCFRNKEEGLVVDWLGVNEMNALYRYNVHQAKADIFIPCGGRPRALREENLDEFLDENKLPTAKAIAEGANLYFSNAARAELEKKGVLIVKDSSANKCGVISSSYEVLAGLTLSEEEFLKVKEELVQEILKRLEKVAFDEAKLLLETKTQTGKNLTTISDEISEKINHFTDLLLAHLEHEKLSNDPNDPLVRCFLNHALPVLRKYQDKLMKEIPDNHKKAIIASYIASHLVYNKGLSWSPALVDILPLILQDELFASKKN